MKNFDFNRFCETNNITNVKLGIEMILKHMHETSTPDHKKMLNSTYRAINTLDAAAYESQVMPVLHGIDANKIATHEVIGFVGFDVCMSTLVLSKSKTKQKKHWFSRTLTTVTTYYITYAGAIERLIRTTCGDAIADKFIVEYRTWEIKFWDNALEAENI